MDKLQWFKFSILDWNMGKIQRAPEITQLRFLRLCCLYWNKECNLSFEDAQIEIDKEHLEILLTRKIVKLNDGIIKIEFLDEQYVSVLVNSEKRQKAANTRWSKNDANAMHMHTHALQDNKFAMQNDADKIRVDKSRKDIDNTLLSKIEISDDRNSLVFKDGFIITDVKQVQYFTIAEKFRQLFIKNLSEKESPFTHQSNAKFKSYTDPIKHMVETDGVTIEQIREAARYLDSKEGEFWKANILSTKKLREQISVMLAKKNEKKIVTVKPIRKD